MRQDSRCDREIDLVMQARLIVNLLTVKYLGCGDVVSYETQDCWELLTAW
jgi:hypothetical protein